MKKVLAWAVVLALVLSSFTMAFAGQAKTSKDFSDASEINYTEAVDVMVATGIINGYPDGTFGPAKTVKRSEMAKMIACIMNGGEDVGDQYKSACPFADSKDHWAAGYIAYCAAEHIIDGRSADVFDPEAEVTGTEVAKMALTSLGYDSKIQGYTGENWAANVLKDAKKNNLFKGLDKSFVPGDPCNRESAAQILFNMLKATEVEYDTNMTVNTGDTTIEVSSKAQPVVDEENGTEEDPYVQLYEDVFGGKLVQNEEDADDFGSPGHSWNYDGDDVGTYVDSPAYEFTAEDEGIEDAIKAFDKDLAKDLEKGKIVINSVTVNGGEVPYVSFEAPGLGDKVKMFEATVAAPAEGVTYYDVVIENYEAVLISAVDTDIDEEEAEEGISAKLELQMFGRVIEADVPDTKIVGFDAATYVEGAVIAVAWNNSEDANDEDAVMVIDSYVMDELASGVVEEINFDDDAITIDGSEYTIATFYNPVDGNTPDVEGEYTLYDYNGYALASVMTAEPETAFNYAILEANGTNMGTFSGTPVVQLFTTEAKEEVIQHAKNILPDFPAGQTQFEENNGLDDILIVYTVDEDGVIDAINEFEEITAGTIGTTDDEGNLVGEKLKTNNVLKVSGKNVKVSDDVVVFWNKAEVKEATATESESQGSEYEILGLSDLANADSISGECFIKDDEVVAIRLTAPLEKAEEPEKILGFVTATKDVKDSEGYKQKVTALIDGKEVSYTTKAGYTSVVPGVAPVEFVVTDNVLTAVNAVTFDDSLELVTDFTEPAVGVTRTGTVADIDGSNLNFGNEQSGPDYQPAGDIVYLNNDGTLEISSLSKIKAGSSVTLYQTDKDAVAWNIVVWTPAN